MTAGGPLKVYWECNSLIRRIQDNHGDVDQKLMRKLWNGHYSAPDGRTCERCGDELLSDQGGVVEECLAAVVNDVMTS